MSRWLDSRSRDPDYRFAGVLSRDEIGRYYASADIFLFPSMTDTFGNVTLEALASGLAVVLGPVPPIPHIGAAVANMRRRGPGPVAMIFGLGLGVALARARAHR